MHKAILMMLLAVVTVMLTVTACSAGAKYKVGYYLMPSDSTDPSKIVMVVGVGNTTYKVFTHFLSAGKLTQAQDYKSLPITTVDTGYVAIKPPNIDGAFSPNKYLSRTVDK